MNEVLLQTIVEKLQALEIALLKQSHPEKDGESSNELTMAVKSVQLELMKVTSEFRTNNELVNKFSKEINTLRVSFVNPKQNEIKHVHHFHKQIWISFSLFIVSLLLAYGWTNCHSEKEQYEANDIKYRFWKANGNTSLLKIIYHTDSLYNLDKDNFTDQVLRVEHQIAEQEKKHRLAGEKKKKR